MIQINIPKTIAYIALVISISAFSTKNSLKGYSPTVESITGTLKILAFPGPPNYEDVDKGDIPEKGFYLSLDKPIDVINKINISKTTFDHVTNVKTVQLAIANKPDWKAAKDGIHIKVEGSFYQAQTGHHHTKVFMLVNKITPV